MAIPEPIETFLLRLGFDYTPVRTPDATSRADTEPEWTRTHVFVADEATPILAVTQAACWVDAERLRQIAGVERLRPATGEELAQFYPESEPGAMPPLGPLYGHGVFVDEALARQPYVTFSAGTAADAIRMRYGDFGALVHPTVGRFARPA